MLEMIIFFIYGIFTGFCGGFFGIGGGTIVVPFAMYFGMDIKQAVGISIIQMVFSSIYGSLIAYKNKLLDIKDGIFVGVGGLVGALFSGTVVSYVPEKFLEYSLLFFIFVMFCKFLFYKHKPGKELKVPTYIFLILGLVVGVAATSVGIGGGLFLTMFLSGFYNYDLKKSVSMGLFFVIFSSIGGFVSMAMHDLLNYKLGILLGVGSLLGVGFGVKAQIKIDRTLQKRIMLVFYLAILVATAYKIFSR